MKSKLGRKHMGEKPPCSIANCDGVARSHETPICGNWLRYHAKLGPVHVFHWQQRLAKFTARGASVGSKSQLRAVAGGRR